MQDKLARQRRLPKIESGVKIAKFNLIYYTNEENFSRQQEKIYFNTKCKKSEMQAVFVELPLNVGCKQPGYLDLISTLRK